MQIKIYGKENCPWCDRAKEFLNLAKIEYQYTDINEPGAFDFVTKTPPASFFLKKFAKIGKGSSATKKDAVVGTVTMSDCEEIAKIKMQDLNANDIAAGAKIIAGTAESMGIKVIKG